MTAILKPVLGPGLLILTLIASLTLMTGCGDKFVEHEESGQIAQRSDVFASELDLIDE